MLSVRAGIYIYACVDPSPNSYSLLCSQFTLTRCLAAQPSPVALKALQVHPFPKMETREPPLSASALFTVQPSLSLFLSIFLSLYALFHRCIGFFSLVNTRDSQLLKTGEEPAQPQKTRSSTTMAAVVDSSLLDSGIEDIPAPILQPKSTDMPVDRTVNEAQSSQGALLDRRLEHLMIPVLEPARVSNFQSSFCSNIVCLDWLTCVLYCIETSVHFPCAPK